MTNPTYTTNRRDYYLKHKKEINARSRKYYYDHKTEILGRAKARTKWNGYGSKASYYRALKQKLASNHPSLIKIVPKPLHEPVRPRVVDYSTEPPASDFFEKAKWRIRNGLGLKYLTDDEIDVFFKMLHAKIAERKEYFRVLKENKPETEDSIM